MRKFFTIILGLLLALCIAFPAQAEFKDMWAYVYKWDGGYNADGTLKLTRLTSGVQFTVLQAGSDTRETLYYFANDAYTSLTNPVTATNFAADTVCKDRVAFRVDPGETNDIAVDLIVTHNSGGYTQFVEDFDQYTHTIVIDERPNIEHIGCVPWAYSDNTATDTGVDFLPDTIIHNVVLEVVTIDATETINIGTADTAAGFISGASVATAAYINPKKPTITAGTTETYVSAASSVGSLLGSSVAGSNTLYDEGSAYLWEHIVTTTGTDDDLYYTGSAGSDTGIGYIYYYFTRLR